MYRRATIGCRKIASVLQVVFGYFLDKIPHYTTIRQWLIRNGFYHLQVPLETADDWVAIGDLTVDVGRIKCLAVIGVRMSRVEWLDNYTLAHRDMTILGLYPTESSTGEFVQKSLQDARNRVGNDFQALVIDQGSDIKKGARLFKEQYQGIKIIHDIAHKLSLVMERALEHNPAWRAFIKKLLDTRQLIQQTEFAAMMPPRQRAKGRFMDISYLVEWPERILQSRQEGYLATIEDKRYEKYFGWIKEFESSLFDWNYMYGAVDLIKCAFRDYGLSRETYEYIQAFFEEILPSEKTSLDLFTGAILSTVQEECNKLNEGETLICMTEVLESLFGKLKVLISGNQGITGNILGLAALVGPERSEEEVKEAMEGSSIQEAQEWVEENLSGRIGKLRHRYFTSFKGTNIANDVECANVA